MAAKPTERKPADLFDQEAIFLPSGSSESPTPASAEGASCADGWTGGRVDGDQKGPLIFFILRYIKH